MSVETIRIGVVDSGCSDAQQVSESAAFVLADSQLWMAEAEPDRIGHGSRIIDIIQQLAPQAEVLSAQVFHDRFTTTAAQVAAAIDWLVDQGAQVINLSLGLRHDRDSLREACARALQKGVILCAASPARGEPVFPSGYPGVFRMTGDARCEREQISHLETEFADFGACVRPLDDSVGQSGASLGCAHLSAHLARYLSQTDAPNLSSARQWLIAQSLYHGPERRGGADD
ncbi:subtilisin-like serine protease QhpE [Marinobacterium sediminicola]|uniref:Subtilase family protein n=1 Tax=Marinobacterium sediminicola TaxID=518898 RepID=A0ABY1RZ21_9GAMM|nr:S8 family serine peptidase [Marinobacterium sediminicola]ULG68061.1 S8 family serine peptidase [Marinobacterium sediminicola]SMR73429.1 Subtilase family protein [Marinobacterium sediminicola]